MRNCALQRYWGCFYPLTGSTTPKRAFALYVSVCTRLRFSRWCGSPEIVIFLFCSLARLLTSLVHFEIRSTQYSSKSNDWANAVTMANLGIAGLSELRSF